MEWKGQNCRVSAPGALTVTDPEQWKELWSKTLGRPEAPPSVDFSKSLAVAVFLGSRPTGGFAVEFLEPVVSGGKAVFAYRVKAPGKGMFVIQAFTQPYAVRVFDRPAVPAEVRESR